MLQAFLIATTIFLVFVVLDPIDVSNCWLSSDEWKKLIDTEIQGRIANVEFREPCTRYNNCCLPRASSTNEVSPVLSGPVPQ